MPYSLRWTLLPLLLFAFSGLLHAQDSLRYYRLYLKDKGTPRRVLRKADTWYPLATAHLTQRALARRAKVLPADALVTTDDLPVFQPYLDAITATGARISQQSRWLNAVMVLTDSATYERLRLLPFLDSTLIPKTRHNAIAESQKIPMPGKVGLIEQLPQLPACISTRYGYAATQNRLIGIDQVHDLGIAGEGVIVGILDAGFKWRVHKALRSAHVIAEHDFVFNDDNTADEAGENGAESHGTDVMSIIGGSFDSVLIGGAPQVSFILAKTEDIRSEHQIEEDNFVAGLEWIESLGADVTNTSLGYTDFDAPDKAHAYGELNGHTAFASRGLNHAVSLGLVCVVAAGNDGGKGYNYVGVPGEADSAIAVAAVDSAGQIAHFSSRGFPSRLRLKPDVAAMGINVFVADHGDTARLKSGPGTSYASPLVTSAVALLLSARPSLTPYEIRTLLYRSGDHALAPDTAYGYGVINVARAIEELSRTRPVVGMPRVILQDGKLSLAAVTKSDGDIVPGSDTHLREAEHLEIEIDRPGEDGPGVTIDITQPYSGTANWSLPAVIDGKPLRPGDSIDIRIISRTTGETIRTDRIMLTEGMASPPSMACFGLPVKSTILANAFPNPFHGTTSISFQTSERATITLIVYNSLGDEMVRLIDARELNAGVHTAFFRPRDVAAGAYYYLLRVGNTLASQEMIYLP